MAIKTQAFQPSSSNLGATIMQSFNMIRGKDVSNFSLYFLDPTTNKKSGEEQSFFMPNIVIGRGAKCHVKYGDDFATVSREHASITSDGQNHFLNHNSSAKNPTFVNGTPISSTHMLKSGDEIQFSHNGPKARFVSSNQVKSSTIGVTSRIGSAVGQALRPYKTAVRVLGVLLVASLGLGAYTTYQNKNLQSEIADTREVMAYLENDIADKENAIREIKDKSSRAYQNARAELSKLKSQVTDLKNKPAEVIYKYKKDEDSNLGNSRVANFTYNETAKKPSQSSTNPTSAAVANQQNLTKKGTPGAAEGYTDGGGAVDNLNLELPDVNLLPKEDVFLLLCKRIEIDFNGRSDHIGVERFYQFDVANSRSEDRTALFQGTGFVTEDGDLITARHLVQPWRYRPKEATTLSRMMEEINVLEANGADVRLFFDAYSESGKEHAFNTANMRIDDSKDEIITTDGKFKLEFFPDLKKGFLRSKKVEMKCKQSTENFSDWARINFANMNSKIKISRPKSEKLRTGTKLHVLGFSHGNNTQSSRRRVEALYSSAIVAQDYTFDGIINTSGLDYGEGNSGGPALLYENGEFIAVGVVTGAIGTSNGVIVPVQNIR